MLALYLEILALALEMQERKTSKAGNIAGNSLLQLLKALIRDTPLGNLGLKSASRQRTRIDRNCVEVQAEECEVVKGTPQKRNYSREAEVREIKTVLAKDEMLSAE